METQVIHLQTDWQYIACRKREQDLSTMYSTRSGLEVTCTKCRKANPAECGTDDYTVRKHGDNYGLYFRGSLVEAGVFATRATAMKHKTIAENERREMAARS